MASGAHNRASNAWNSTNDTNLKQYPQFMDTFNRDPAEFFSMSFHTLNSDANVCFYGVIEDRPHVQS